MNQAQPVGAFLNQVRARLQQEHSRRWLRGEITETVVSAQGHIYFKLKDRDGVLGAVLWSSKRLQSQFQPSDGITVLALGSLTIYSPRGQLQFVVEKLLPDGIGQYFVALEKLKQKLTQEGLFAASRKRPLPFFPQRVGVVTSQEGSVWHDIQTTLQRRNPAVQLLLSPSPVQGDQAVASLIVALKRLLSEGVEVVILARGGGSWEDLMPFNREILVRFLASYPLPVIAAIGHETDTCLCDLVADQRAPTPTGAAEIVAPHVEQLRQELHDHRRRLLAALQQRVRLQRERLENLRRRPCLNQPEQLYLRAQQTLQHWSQRLANSTARSRQVLDQLQSRLQPSLLEAHCRHQRQRLLQLSERLPSALLRHFEKCKAQLSEPTQMLNSLSPKKVLKRGYSLCRDGQGRVVTSISGRKAQDQMEICLADGSLNCSIQSITTVQIDGKDQSP